jgi:hypothetical protein
MEIEIIDKPTKEINKKLIELIDNDRDSSFYANYSLIQKAFIENRLLCFIKKEKLIGFMTYTINDILIEIDIFCVDIKERGKGNGSIIYKNIEQYFRRKKAIAFKLFSEPKQSEGFWKKQGFLKTNIEHEHPLEYWKPIVKRQENSTDINCQNKIEIWQSEPYLAHKNEPKSIYHIENMTDNIIEYLNKDWALKITKNGKKEYFEKIKRLPIGNYNNNLLIITKADLKF